MTKNSKREAFTIVELVIVIAVIAIICSVAIPTFLSVIKKAKISAKEQEVYSMNQALKSYEALDVPVNCMYTALNAVKEFGIECDSVKIGDEDHIIAWNVNKNRFVVVDKNFENTYENGKSEAILTPTDFWIIADEIPTVQIPSIYLTGDFSESVLNVTVGIDVGDVDNITSINYTDTDEKVKNIVIRINDVNTSVNVSEGNNDIITIISPDGTSQNGEDDNTNPIPDPFDPSKIIAEEGKVIYSLVDNQQHDSVSSSVENGGYQLLLADVEEDAVIVTKETILDLNGYKLSKYKNGVNESAIIVDGAKLTICDSSVSGTGMVYGYKVGDHAPFPSTIKLINGGSLVLEDGTIAGEYRAIECTDGTYLAINGGTVKGESGSIQAISVSNNCTLDINGGLIEASDKSRIAIRAGDESDNVSGYIVNIKSGVINGRIVQFGDGMFDISGGVFNGDLAILTIRNGTVKISGGEFYTTGKSSALGKKLPNSSADIFNFAGAILHIDAVKVNSCKSDIVIDISGGTFKSDNYYTVCATANKQSTNNRSFSLNIHGGDFITPSGYTAVICKSNISSGVSVTNDLIVTIEQ